MTMKTPTPNAPSPIDFAATRADEPLGRSLASRTCPAAFDGAIAHRFEFSSRGDRVPGRLLLPDARSTPCPLVLAVGAAGSDCDSPEFDFCSPLVRDGFAIATIDLSLYGERASAKFSARLLVAIADAASADKLDANGQALLIEFTRQSISDIKRSFDALSEIPAIDAERIALLGQGHGAALAVIAASVDPRVKATVLAECSAVDLSQIDPRGFAQAVAPRPVLALDPEGSSEDDSIFVACAEPRTRHCAGASGATLTGDGAKLALDFLRQHLAT